MSGMDRERLYRYIVGVCGDGKRDLRRLEKVAEESLARNVSVSERELAEGVLALVEALPAWTDRRE